MRLEKQDLSNIINTFEAFRKIDTEYYKTMIKLKEFWKENEDKKAFKLEVLT